MTTRFGAGATVTICEAIDCLQRVHDAHAIIPENALLRTAVILTRIQAVTQRDRLRTVGDLLAASSSVVSDVARVSNVTAFHDDADSNALHTARNTLAALITAAYVANGYDPRPTYKAMPALKMRTRLHRRPLEDDEIFLSRLFALHLILRGNPTERRNGAAYVIADAGLPPTEATALRIGDLVLEGSQPLLMMHANRSFQDRLLRLEPFHVLALRAHLAQLDGDLVAYRPRKNSPGSNQAAASMHGVLGRLLQTVGIVNDDLTASCVYTWGLRRILDEHGVEEALLAAGFEPRASGSLLKLVNRADNHPAAPTTVRPEHTLGF